ncbi:glycosyltransferase family 2 protein [Altericista sp. CCNU0014]|uniref:glycosyltransferase family 2 protein n=1 Tax=Altericista sp. CCNU0014 TaxID=3082949 RepID=UPI00384C00ED
MDVQPQPPTDPLVSVIIPAYNAEVFIARTLQSVLAQTYRHLEVLVVDDGSTDRTAAIVESIARQDRRAILLQQENAGVAAARNLALARAKGALIAPIDADDLWFPENLEKQVNCLMRASESVGLIYSWSVDIDEADLPSGGFHAAQIEGAVYATLICHNFIGNASATLMRRTCIESVGGYRCEFKQQNAQGCEDWDLYLRIAERYQFGVVPEFLVGYRKISDSMSRDYGTMARSQQLMLQTIRQNHPEIPGFLYCLSRSSFYLYLAHQSDTSGNARVTLFWLRQAVKVDPVTPLGRLGFYLLLVKSFAKLAAESWQFSSKEAKPAPILSHPIHGFRSPTPACSSTILLPALQINVLQILFKVWFGAFLHQLLSKI